MLDLSFNHVRVGTRHVNSHTIRELSLHRNQLTDEGLGHVLLMSKLARLDLFGNQLTAVSMARIKQLAYLEELNISGNLEQLDPSYFFTDSAAEQEQGRCVIF